ncbi:MAG: PilZ domain-containing protein [Armatimonadota bacterium]
MEQAASDPWPRGEAASGSAAEASAEPPGTSAQSGPAAASAPDPAPADPAADMRAAPRFTLLIRAAKLVCAKGEFVCVIRDVSETGVSVRLFHRLPSGGPYELHMPGGVAYEMRAVWQRDNEAGFEFTRPVEVSRLISEAGQYPKRGIRLDRVEVHRGPAEGAVRVGLEGQPDAAARLHDLVGEVEGHAVGPRPGHLVGDAVQVAARVDRIMDD